MATPASALDHLHQRNTARLADQTVTRLSLGAILLSPDYSQVVVPVFQRGFCWSSQQLEVWWGSVLQGTEVVASGGDLLTDLSLSAEDSSQPFHSCGIGRFRQSGSSLVCVDGQQRLTSTALLVSAVRDCLHSVAGSGPLLVTSHSVLFSCLEEQLGEGEVAILQDKVRLLPSQPDRRDFFLAMLGRPGGEGHISRAKIYFTSRLQDHLASLPREKHLDFLTRVLQSCLVWVRMMSVTVHSELSLCQWFLWLQEKSLFGLAALLMNDTPGVNFDASDLAKNLLLSAFMDRPMKEQEEILENRWSRWAGPLQRKTGNLDQLLGDFLDKQGFSDPRMEQAGGDNTRHVSSYERSIIAMADSTAADSDEEEEGKEEEDGLEKRDKFAGICLYSRFKSYYDFCVESSSEIDLEEIHGDILNKMESFSTTLP